MSDDEDWWTFVMHAHLVFQTIENQSQHDVLIFDRNITYLSILVRNAINLVL
jgi:hypothetical protein